MKTLKILFVALLTLFCVNSFSQTTHTFTLDVNDIDSVLLVDVNVDDDFIFVNDLGSIENISVIINDIPDGSFTIPNGGTIYTSNVNSTEPLVVKVKAGLYSKKVIFNISQSTAGISENVVSYSVYPNPTTDFLNINGVDITSVKVFDMNGRMVLNDNTNKINVSELSKGYYTLVVNETSSVRFVKN